MIRRRLFSLASFLSLLLCVATVVLWVRSYFQVCAIRITKIHWDTSDTTWSFCYRVSSEVGCVRGEIYWHTENGDAGYKGTRNSLLPYAAPEGLHLQAQPKDVAFHKDNGTGRPWEWHGLGFLFSGENPFTTPSYWAIGVREFFAPAWSVSLLFTILPLIRIMAFIRSMKQFPEGACLSCRYNLTGNTSGVCPECGTAVAGKASG